MKIFKMLFRVFGYWLYYRFGWIRAAYLGVSADWRAKISPRAEIDGAISLGTSFIGGDVIIKKGSYLASGVIHCANIGNYCSIGPDVVIGPTEHRLDYWTTSPYEAIACGNPPGITDKEKKVPIICDGVWIGAKVVVLQGVVIGERSVVAAGAVVTKNSPPNELWGGVPAKFIKKRKVD